MRYLFLVGMLTVGPCAVVAQPAPADLVERNVVYGMQSGLALLLDVHRGPQPNGLGVIVIHGTGWSTAYASAPMKEDPYQLEVLVKPLVTAGYTAFVINHRAAPPHQYPAALDDAVRGQVRAPTCRAVRDFGRATWGSRRFLGRASGQHAWRSPARPCPGRHRSRRSGGGERAGGGRDQCANGLDRLVHGRIRRCS